jgi:hypothetical protein
MWKKNKQMKENAMDKIRFKNIENCNSSDSPIDHLKKIKKFVKGEAAIQCCKFWGN